jgi:hypothetical protein
MVRKAVVVAAVAATAFICGWQSAGAATGLAMAAALGGGAVAAVLAERDGRRSCVRLRRRR